MIAKLLINVLFPTLSLSQSIIHSQKGFGTYYYDVEQLNACQTDFSYQNEGGVMCSSAQLLSLTRMNTNRLVAMNNTQLRENPSLYCGKKVLVSVNGQPSGLDLFIGDGCQRCGIEIEPTGTWNAEGAPGLDFSFTTLNELSNGLACDKGHIALSWEITDETAYRFDNEPVATWPAIPNGSPPTTTSDVSSSPAPVAALSTAVFSEPAEVQSMYSSGCRGDIGVRI